jgi:dynein heavy chain
LNLIGLENTESNVFEIWSQTLKKYLHIFVSLSPNHFEYKNNLRNFPSLVNCTTTDFYFEWEHEALVKVAEYKLATTNLGEFKIGLIECVAKIHK